MATLQSIFIKKETLKTILNTLEKKEDSKGIELTISTDDKLNDYGQNVSAFVSQTKEQRDEKKKRFYVGNGKCFWTDGVIKTAQSLKEPDTAFDENTGEFLGEEDDLPF